MVDNVQANINKLIQTVKQAIVILKEMDSVSAGMADRIDKSFSKLAGATVATQGLNVLKETLKQVAAVTEQVDNATRAGGQGWEETRNKLVQIDKAVKELITDFKALGDAQINVGRRTRTATGQEDVPLYPTDDELKGRRGRPATTVAQSFFESEDAAKRFQAQLEKLGVAGEGWTTKLQGDLNSGLGRFIATGKDANGVAVQLTGTMNRAGNLTQASAKGFQSFTDSLAKNFIQVTKWTIAVTALYAPMRYLQDLVEIAIKNQTELATITITLGESFTSIETVFNDVAEAAKATGESIDGVLEGYTQAIRAAGGISGEYERLIVANKLLTDSLVLSKISTLDQAKAMDILVAALRQTREEGESEAEVLSRGTELLDRWVAVTRVANVDIRTLAESFSIVAATAKGAGIEVGGIDDELSGLIAVLAESTKLSPTETGNALRAAIAGLNKEVARATLREFGISVTDTEDKMIGFLETSKQIAYLYEQGLISEDQLARIAIAIGGGVRRQGQVLEVLKNIARAEEINRKAAGSTGDAYEALDVHLQTVQTSLTNLQNSFVELAQTLGTEGGILRLVTDLSNTLSGLIGIVDRLSQSFGKAGPALAAFLILQKYASAQGFGFGGGALGLGGFLGANLDTGSRLGKGLTALGGQGGIGAGVNRALGVAGVAYSAIGNIRTQDYEEVAGNIGGGIIGFLISGGNPVGAVIGSAIGESFVREAFTYSTDIGRAIAEAQFEQAKEDAEDGETATAGDEYTPEERDAEFFKLLGLGWEELGKWRVAIQAFIGEGYIAQLRASGEGVYQRDLSELEGEELKSEIARIMVATSSPEEYADLVEQFNVQAAAAGELPVSQFDEGVDETARLFDAAFEEFIDNMQDSILEKLVGGEIEGAEAKRVQTALSGIQLTSSQIFEAAGDSFKEFAEGIADDEDAILQLADIYIKATSEQQQVALEWKEEIRILEDAMQAAIEAGSETVTLLDGEVKTRDEINEAITDNKNALGAFLAELQRAQELEAFTPRDIINAANYTLEELQQIERRAREVVQPALMAEKYGEYGQEFLEQQDPFSVAYGGGNLYYLVEGIFTEAWRKAQQQLEQEGALGTSAQKQNVQAFDFAFGSAQQQQFEMLYRELYQLFTQAGYEPELVDTFEFYSNKHIESNERDLLLVRLALQEIADIERKQLDGIYNLPSGANVFVPLAAAQLVQQNQLNNVGGVLAQLASLLQDTQEEVEVSNIPTPSEAQAYSQIQKMQDRLFELTYPGYDEGTHLPTGGGAYPLSETLDTGRTDTTRGAVPPETQVDRTPVVRLDLAIDARFETHLNGRILANEIKRYLVEDITAESSSTGGTVQKFVL